MRITTRRYTPIHRKNALRSWVGVPSFMLIAATQVLALPLNKELIQAIGQAQKEHFRTLQQGKGRAVVTIRKEYAGGDEDGPGSGNMLMEFMFKGGKTRTDAYAQHGDGSQGKLRWIWIDTGESELEYNPGEGSAHIMGSGDRGSGGYRKVGHDFHPETFARLRGLTTEEVLLRFLTGADTTDCHLDNNGLLTITAGGTDGPTVQLVLDAKNNYTIVSLDSKAVMDKAGSVNLTTYEAEFSPGAVVPHRIVYENAFQLKGRAAIAEKNRLCTKEHYEVEVVDFHPADVDAMVFELDALGIPPGTRMQDARRGLVYKYKSVDNEEEVLKEILEGPTGGVANPVAEQKAVPESPVSVPLDSGRGHAAPASSVSSRLLWVIGLGVVCILVGGSIVLAMKARHRG